MTADVCVDCVDLVDLEFHGVMEELSRQRLLTLI